MIIVSTGNVSNNINGEEVREGGGRGEWGGGGRKGSREREMDLTHKSS